MNKTNKENKVNEDNNLIFTQGNLKKGLKGCGIAVLVILVLSALIAFL